MVDQGLRVGIIDLTDGEPTPRCPDVETRIREANAAAAKLGIHRRIILDLPNRRLFDSFEARIQLAKEFRRFQPKIVIGLGSKTPMASPDHWQAVQITDAAVFYSRLTKWDQYFDGLPVHSIGRQVYYTLFFEDQWSGLGGQQFVFDISTTLQKKLDAVRCYETQFPAAKQYIFQRVEAMAVTCGTAAGFDAGEVFTSTRAIGTRDMFATLFPDKRD